MMKLPLAEVFEMAIFYAHFDVMKESDPPIPPLTVRVCGSLTCALFGADKLLHAMRSPEPARMFASRSHPASGAAIPHRSPRPDITLSIVQRL
jgi:hypothetical protein